MCCSVKAGEMLYLPSLWFHHVQQSHGCVAGRSELKQRSGRVSTALTTVRPRSELLVRHGVRHQVQLLPAAGVSV